MTQSTPTPSPPPGPPGRGEQLGNFPQAFSHIGLIKAAWEIDKAKGASG